MKTKVIHPDQLAASLKGNVLNLAKCVGISNQQAWGMLLTHQAVRDVLFEIVMRAKVQKP